VGDETPLDLRALADVDEPDVVRDALRRFRRRILTRYVWIAAAAAVAIVAVSWGRASTSLSQRVDEARRQIIAHPVWHANGATIALDRVADLGEGRLGFHFVVIGSAARLQMTGQVGTEAVGSFDQYIEIERTETYPTLVVDYRGRTSISLAPGSGVPRAVWRL
jgi:hypothetical protein